MVVNLFPHQQKAVDKLGNGKILWGGVGTGKSLTALAYFYTKVCKGVIGDLSSLRTPRDIYIITTAKKRDSLDWEQDAAKFGIGRKRDASVCGIQIKVDSWNSIHKYTEVKDAFFIFDEQRLVGSGAWTKSFIKIAKRNEWVLLSATPGDTWLDYIPVFVANGFYKNRTEFKQQHVVYNTYSKFPKVDRYLEAGRLVKLRNQLLVHMPYDRHTTSHNQEIVVDYDHDLFDKVVNKRWHVYEKRPLRGMPEVFSVMRKVVNTNSSRLEAIRTLMESHPRLIVFYNFDYELEILRELAKEDGSSTSPTSMNCTNSSSQSLGKRIESSIGSTTCEAGVPSPTNETYDRSNQCLSTKMKLQPDGSTSKTLESSSKQPSGSNFGSGSGTTSNTFGKESDSLTTDEEEASGFQTVESNAGRRSDTLTIAEWNGHNHDEIPKTDRWVYLVQYVAGAEGWNCVDTNAVVFYSLTYSYKNYHQAKGRIDRLNTPFTDLWYYTLVSRSLIDKAVSRSLKAKKSFNESNLALK